MYKFYFFVLVYCCHSLAGKCQEYSYKHYEIKDGLVGNNVYEVAEDKDGFLWFATETGVSRFDGSNFKSFTTAEGLPDNEVLGLFVDSKGRVWIMPFKNALCYFYKGQIYNAGNDSTIRSLQPESWVTQIFEDSKQNLYFVEQRELLVLRNDGKVFRKGHVENDPTFFTYAGNVNNKDEPLIFENVNTGLYSINFSADSIALRVKADSIHFYGKNSRMTYLTSNVFVYPDNYHNRLDLRKMVFNNYVSNRSDTIPTPVEFNLISFLNDSILFFNTNFGALKYNYIKHVYLDEFLQNEHISNTLRDHEGNLWFTTLGNGVYRLYSEDNRNIYFTDNNLRNSVESILVTDSLIFAGVANSKVHTVKKQTLQPSGDYLLQNRQGIKKVFKMINQPEGIYILAEDGLYFTDKKFKNLEEIPVSEHANDWIYKDMDIKDDKVYLASHYWTLAYSVTDKTMETVDENRGTAVCVVDSGLFIGTLKGLLFVNWNKKVTDLSKRFPLLSNRITKLFLANNKLWIGTNDEGVVCYNGNRIEKNITTKEGLTSNLVRVLYANKNFLWVGTDRGVNKISLLNPTYPVLRVYTTSDGLSGNMINALYVQSDTIYVGTSKGLSVFDDRTMNSNSICDMRLLGITVSGKEMSYDLSKLLLAHNNNNIRFDFVAISYKAEGNILYYYKLSGIDTDWKKTRVNFLEYPTLPSGNYTLLLYAVNKFGVSSKTIEIKFEIEKTLVERVWFLVLIILLFIFTTWLLANRQIQRSQGLQQEKTANAEKIAQLEQQALKAQMNPHFIFNCLNSIQQYVIDKDVEGANKFISGFSRLIRQTLENSGKHSITVAEEENFLHAYLQLEKSRFEDKFTYNINIDPGIQKDEDRLPPMLLQPYIENCIRHGIMHKKNGMGNIDIQFKLANAKLICSVTDNGIGRNAAGIFKSDQHINYQSRGTELTGQRIMMINKNNKSDIVLKVEDLTDEEDKPCGTRVTIVIPLEKSK